MKSDVINYNLFFEKTRSLKLSSKFFLYDRHIKDPFIPFVANFAIGFGSGHFLQGDTSAGWLSLILYGSGIGLIGIGLLPLPSPLCSAFFVAGGATLVITKFYDVLHTFSYAEQYNTALRVALGLENTVHFKIEPDTSLQSLKIGITSEIRF